MDRALVIDVGNTRIKLAEADAAGVGQQTVSLETKPLDDLDVRLEEVLEEAGLAAPVWAAASVVPDADEPLARAAKRLGARLGFVPGDFPVGLTNRYEKPAEVGADRLAVAFAARRMSEAPAVIAVDFGTATTLDCVKGADYLGGLICPGVLSSARALGCETAKLPRPTLELDDDAVRPGRSTMDSLNQGLVFGFAAMVQGLVERLERTLATEGERAFVVATGGFAPRIAAVCPRIDAVAASLVLEGIRLAAFGHGEEG